MKKKAVIGMAIFYLVFSTGMFVCLFNYGSRSIAKLVTLDEGSTSRNESLPLQEKDVPCGTKLALQLMKHSSKPDTKTEVPGIKVVDLHLRAPYILPLIRVQEGRFHAYSSTAPPNHPTPIYLQLRVFRI